MEKTSCYDCELFWQHYIVRKHRFTSIHMGHCVRKQNPHDGSTICKHFIPLDKEKEAEDENISIKKTLTEISKELNDLNSYLANK